MTGNSILADSNIFIDLMKGDAAIANKLENFDTVFLSPIVLAELRFGAFRSANPPKHLDKIELAIQRCKLLAIDKETSELFVDIKISLLKKGKPIPENDIWIAASAWQHELLLYSNDRHFSEIEGINLV